MRAAGRRSRRAHALPLATALLAPLALFAVAGAGELDLSLDLRAVSTHAPATSFIDGGAGKLRFDDAHDGLRLGRARLALRAPLGERWALRLDASSWGDGGPLDLTEAYLEYRPYPSDGWRTRLRAGAFYAPLSLENSAPGWDSPYTLTSSAGDSWLAEETRTLGVEADAGWLGTRTGHSSDLTLRVAAFGWNDPAGVGIASHGFALTDRQTGLFARRSVVGRYAPYMPDRRLFTEIDGRAGWYAGLDWKYRDLTTLRALHYDNRADPARFDAAAGEMAWRTSFDGLAARIEPDDHWTVIAQWVAGKTSVAPPDDVYDWSFDSAFLLASRSFGMQRASARLDFFHVSRDGSTVDRGHAWTLAWMIEPDQHWRLALEFIAVAGLAPAERQLQLSARYRLTQSWR